MNKEVAIRPEPEIAAAAAVPRSRAVRRWMVRLLFWSVPLLLAAGGYWWWLGSGRYVTTDNAYVQQNKLSVTTQVAGPIVEVAVRENQPVQAGDLLFRIDPTPYRIALARAEAEMGQARVRVAELRSTYQAAVPDIGAAEQKVRFTAESFERQQELWRRGFTTRADYDEALYDLQEAQAQLAKARAEAQTARAALGTAGTATQPAVALARATRDAAAFDLTRTEVRAPIAGRISQADRLLPGQAAVAGLPLVSIVDTRATWIEANFKETDLAKIRVGQPARIELDAYPGRRLRGYVASIGAGTGAEFAVLPPQNASGNWVKVTQRVPVRIMLTERGSRELIAGMSAEVRVDTGRGER